MVRREQRNHDLFLFNLVICGKRLKRGFRPASRVERRYCGSLISDIEAQKRRARAYHEAGDRIAFAKQ